VRPKVALVGLLIATILVLAVVFYFTDFTAINPFRRRAIESRLPDYVNVLVLGLDASERLSDVILVVSIDRKQNSAHFLSVPRDTRVDIEGYGFRKVNSAYALGGEALAVKTIERLLNIKMDGYLVINFNGFAKIIDAIGGIPIEVEKPMKYTDVAGGLYIDIPAGLQVLDGKKATDYVRYRESTRGDLGRIERQHGFIWAAIKRLIAKPDKIPMAVSLIQQSLKTDIDLRDALPMAVDFIQSLVLDRQDFLTLPGKPDYIGGVSYYLADADAASKLDFIFRR